MADRYFTSLAAFARQLRKDVSARAKRINRAVKKTAKQATQEARQYVPKAFSELADSIHLVELSPGSFEIVADAPHAAAVENGTRPHMPPLDPLIAWVELRGMQGLTVAGDIASHRDAAGRFLRKGASSKASAAQVIAKSLLGRMGREGASAWRGRVSQGPLAGREHGHDPAVVALARAIQMAIAKRGTRPQKFMQKRVDPTRSLLDRNVRAALPDR